MEVSQVAEDADRFKSYLIVVRGQPRLRPHVLIALALCAATLAGCGEQQDDSDRWRRAGPWAEPPAEKAMPAAAPDDPATYRGVRFRIGRHPDGMPRVEAAGRPVPWMRTSMGPSYGNATQNGTGPLFGYRQMADGRRRMVWFFRFLGPALVSEHEGAVLDVLVLPGELEWGLRTGCAFDPVIIDGDDGWRLNQTTGRVEMVDPEKASCPKD